MPTTGGKNMKSMKNEETGGRSTVPPFHRFAFHFYAKGVLGS